MANKDEKSSGSNFQPGTGTAQERAGLIAEKTADAGPGGYFVLYRGQYRELPVIDISQDKLVYRADNGRLITDLQKLQKKKGLEPDYHSKRQEEPRVQKDLHRLLVNLSQDPQGPIYQELELQGMQTEALLITSDGIVVNGNRRLAAMRELLFREPDRYSRFSTVRAAVLPAEAGAQDIEYVEAALQLAPETKLAYSWINRRLTLRRHRDILKLPLDKILESYRLQSAQELDTELQELALAESYLADYCLQPEEYSLVDEEEEQFRDLNATLQDPVTPYPDLWKLAGFAMIFNRKKLKLKLKGYFPFAEAKPAFAPRQALFELAGEEGLLSRQQVESQDKLPIKTQQELAALLGQKSESQRLAQAVVDILDQIRIDYHDKSAPKRLIKNMKQARKISEKLGMHTLNSKQKAELASELAAIKHHSSRLLEDSPDAPPPMSHRARKLRKLRENPYAYFADAKNPLMRKLKVFFTPKK